jgi:arylsulfatase A-like enzyme
VRDLYDAELWSLDREVDRFLARLDLGRTAVVLTSDHGEAFGEHGQYEHKDVLECHTRVPLLVRPAGSEDGREVREPVHGIDVAPTLLALAGLAPSTEQLGVNLLGPIGSERILLVENRDNVDPSLVKLALYAGDWKLVQEVGRDRTPRWRLYDVAQDPAESQDRATDRPEVVERLRAELEALRARWGADDERDGRVQRVDNPDALDALGYGGD